MGRRGYLLQTRVKRVSDPSGFECARLDPLGFECAQNRQTPRPSIRDPQKSPAFFRIAAESLEDPAIQCERGERQKDHPQVGYLS